MSKGKMSKIAIIGGGITGVTLAMLLQDHAKVTLLEKSRGLGGRMAHRRAEPFAFDHGAAYLTIRDNDFADRLAPYQASGLLRPWPLNPVIFSAHDQPVKRDQRRDSYALAGSANALVKTLAAEHCKKVDFHFETTVKALGPETDSSWNITTDHDHSMNADWIISTVPAPQTAVLMPDEVSFAEDLGRAKMQACFTMMLGFDHIIPMDWDAGWGTSDDPIGFVADNRQKPDRGLNQTALTVHAGNAWSDQHFDQDLDKVQQQMKRRLLELTGIDAAKASHLALHRWRYANAILPAGQAFLLDQEKGLAAAGDWCLGGRIENGYLSASALARKITDLI